jgi:hypothetical protein
MILASNIFFVPVVYLSLHAIHFGFFSRTIPCTRSVHLLNLSIFRPFFWEYSYFILIMKAAAISLLLAAKAAYAAPQFAGALAALAAGDTAILGGLGSRSFGFMSRQSC